MPIQKILQTKPPTVIRSPFQATINLMSQIKVDMSKLVDDELAFYNHCLFVAAVMGAIITIPLTIYRFNWGKGFLLGLLVSLALSKAQIWCAQVVHPGANVRQVKLKIYMQNLVKWPLAAIVIFFTVKLGIAPAGCFCAGFSLVYLSLTGNTVFAMMKQNAHQERR